MSDSIFPCDCPMCDEGVCDDDGVCDQCHYDYLHDSEDDPPPLDWTPEWECPECKADLETGDNDSVYCPDCDFRDHI